MGVERGRSPAAAIVAALVWLGGAGCGSRLADHPTGMDAAMMPAPGRQPAGPGSRPDAAAVATHDGGVPNAPGTSTTLDAGNGPAGGGAAGAQRDGGARATSSTDGGTPLAPDPPTICPTPARPLPAHAAVSTCGGELTLSSAVTLSATPDHFFRCGALGPEVATDLRLSPDGRWLAVLTGAGTIRLWATGDWHEIAQIAPPTGRVDAFAVSPTGDALATLSTERGEITLWSPLTGTPVTTFHGTGTAGNIPVSKAMVAFSRDGSRLVSSMGGIIDRETGAVVALQGRLGPVDQLAFTMCDAMVYARFGYRVGDSPPSTQVSLYDAATGQEQTQFAAWTTVFGGSALSQDGRLLAVSGADRTDGLSYDLSIYRGDTGQLVDYWPGWMGGQVQAFTPDGTALMVATSTQELIQWRLADQKVVGAFSFGDGSRLLGFSRSSAVTISDPSQTATFGLNANDDRLYALPFGATAASWSADGAIGAALAPDGALFHVWQDSDGTPLCAPTAPPSTTAPTSFALSGDGRVLGLGKADGVIDLLNSQTGVRRTSIETVQGPIQALALSADGELAASQLDGRSPVLIWSANGSLLGTVPLPAHAGTTTVPPSSFALSPDGGTVALSDGTSTTVVDVASGRAQAIQPAAPWAVGAAFSPDGRHLAGWVNGAVATWRVADGVSDDVLAAPPALAGRATSGSVSLGLIDDWSMAAALDQTELVLWDLPTGNALLDLPLSSYGEGNSILALGTATLAVNEFLIHTLDGDYSVAHLYDTATGVDLRQFTGFEGPRPLLLAPDGQRAYTLESPDVIAWCR